MVEVTAAVKQLLDHSLQILVVVFVILIAVLAPELLKSLQEKMNYMNIIKIARIILKIKILESSMLLKTTWLDHLSHHWSTMSKNNGTCIKCFEAQGKIRFFTNRHAMVYWKEFVTLYAYCPKDSLWLEVDNKSKTWHLSFILFSSIH